jgi:hypothetical protein
VHLGDLGHGLLGVALDLLFGDLLLERRTPAAQGGDGGPAGSRILLLELGADLDARDEKGRPGS